MPRRPAAFSGSFAPGCREDMAAGGRGRDRGWLDCGSWRPRSITCRVPRRRLGDSCLQADREAEGRQMAQAPRQVGEAGLRAGRGVQRQRLERPAFEGGGDHPGQDGPGADFHEGRIGTVHRGPPDPPAATCGRPTGAASSDWPGSCAVLLETPSVVGAAAARQGFEGPPLCINGLWNARPPEAA
jgi:hypothetical protein